MRRRGDPPCRKKHRFRVSGVLARRRAGECAVHMARVTVPQCNAFLPGRSPLPVGWEATEKRLPWARGGWTRVSEFPPLPTLPPTPPGPGLASAQPGSTFYTAFGQEMARPPPITLSAHASCFSPVSPVPWSSVHRKDVQGIKSGPHLSAPNATPPPPSHPGPWSASASPPPAHRADRLLPASRRCFAPRSCCLNPAFQLPLSASELGTVPTTRQLQRKAQRSRPAEKKALSLHCPQVPSSPRLIRRQQT